MTFIEIDGVRWSVERRHELTQLRTAGAAPGRRLLIVFTSPRGAVMPVVVPDDFPAEPDAALLEKIWRQARQ